MLKKLNKKYLAGMGVILALTGCTSVADMVGYDTATLNEDAAKSYSQV
ncbi:M48 family peptidase, partial [Neisseria sp. P0001.S010]